MIEWNSFSGRLNYKEIYWRGIKGNSITVKGNFTVKSFVAKVNELSEEQNSSHKIMNKIWKEKVPRAQLLVWFALMERLNTERQVHQAEVTTAR